MRNRNNSILDEITTKEKEKFTNKIKNKIKDLDNSCTNYNDQKNKLKDLISEITEH